MIAAHAAPAERRRLTEPAERRAAASSFLDATSYGVAGMIEDYLACSRAWGFSPADVEAEVKGMQLGRLSSFMTMATLERLRNRAYSPAEFERLANQSPFQSCEVTTAGIGLEVRLGK